MQTVTIKSSICKGTIKIPPSKSLAHRAVIAAGLSHGECQIQNLAFSKDIMATLKGMKNLGSEYRVQGDTVFFYGKGKIRSKHNFFDCEESGSTLRFLLPLSLAIENKVEFIGKGRLLSRPQGEYYKIFDEKNIEYTTNHGMLPLKVKGKLPAGNYFIAGNISSQFITGLLYTLPLLEDDSTLTLTTPLESIGYVDLTLDILNRYGITIKNNQYQSFEISGNQTYKGVDYRVEGDFSQAAFWMVAACIGEEIQCTDLNPYSLQGDKAIVDIIKRMQGSITFEKDTYSIKPTKTSGAIIDVSQCPDLVPILAVLASLSEGTTEIINAARLRIKESDRLKAITTELKKLGATIEEKEDSLLIRGKDTLQGGFVDSWNDHRIAMALAIASIRCEGEVTITGSESVEKSYPNFWDDFIKMGGEIQYG